MSASSFAARRARRSARWRLFRHRCAGAGPGGGLCGAAQERGRRLAAAARYGRPEDFDVIERLVEVASEAGAKPAQVAVAWLLQKPGVTAPIIGATKATHLDDAIAAAELTLSPDQASRLEEPYRPHPILGH